VVLAALTPAVPAEEVRSLVARLAKGDKRELVLLKLLTLAPERAAVLTPLLAGAGGAR
jgi:hypothetical protein